MFRTNVSRVTILQEFLFLRMFFFFWLPGRHVSGAGVCVRVYLSPRALGSLIIPNNKHFATRFGNKCMDDGRAELDFNSKFEFAFPVRSSSNIKWWILTSISNSISLLLIFARFFGFCWYQCAQTRSRLAAGLFRKMTVENGNYMFQGWFCRVRGENRPPMFQMNV